MRSFEELNYIRKSLEANPGLTDIKDLVGGGALSAQFLDNVLVAIIETDNDFRFLKELPKRKITQVIAEYTKQISTGWTNYYTSFVNQNDDPRFVDTQLKRLYDQVAFLSEGFQYNRVIANVQNIEDPEVIQANSAMMRILRSLSTAIWHGDKDTLSVEFTGFKEKIQKEVPENVYDCRGQLPSISVIKDFASKIRRKYYGLPNKMYVSVGTKNLIDNTIVGDSNHYVFTDATKTGSVFQSKNVAGIYSSQAKDGVILYDVDLWIDDSNLEPPKVYDPNTNSYIEGSIGKEPPNTPIVYVSVQYNIPGSLWGSGDAGTIRYRVSAINSKGISQASTPFSVYVNAGVAVEITITPDTNGPYAEAFVIFRETSPGSGIYKKIKRIKRSTNFSTVYVDLNEDLPGTTIAILGDFNSRSTADETRTCVLSELLPPLKTTFPPGIAGLRQYTGMIEYYCVLQIFAPEKFVLFKNIPVE